MNTRTSDEDETRVNAAADRSAAIDEALDALERAGEVGGIKKKEDTFS